MNCVISIGRGIFDTIVGDVCGVEPPDSADAPVATDRGRITTGGGVGG